MTGISAVCVYNYLTACKSAVSVWSTNNKTTCWIYKILCIFICKFLWNYRVNNIFTDVLMYLFLRNLSSVLWWDNYRIYMNRSAILVIFNSNLTLTVSTKIRKCSVFADLRKFLCKFVCKCDRIRHIFVCFVCCITKHHTLVACTDCLKFLVRHLIFFCFKCLVNTHCNICWLWVEKNIYLTGITVKTFLIRVISDFSYCLSCNLFIVNFCLSRNLTHDKHIICRDSCLAGNTAHGILLHKCVKYRIRNIVAYLVRMSFCYWFRCK